MDIIVDPINFMPSITCLFTNGVSAGTTA